MRRLAAVLIVMALTGVGVLVAGTMAQGSTKSQHIDVIFDDARGLISGQQVKIAGAEAGSVDNVVVDYIKSSGSFKARVEATVNGPFTFFNNATCIIRPDGLIAENYLDCNPGTAKSGLLKGQNGFPPTVQPDHTSEPVSIQDLFNIFNLPTRERFQVFIDELGITTAGDGDAINSILQRANPTLQAAQRVIAILDKQDNQIADEIDNTNAIAKSGVSHIADVQNFIKKANALSQLTANHADSLEQTINKLPGYLEASTPALKEVNTFASDATPLLKSLYEAAPYLNRVDNDIVPFTKLAKPALGSLATAFAQVIPGAKKATPLVRTISHYLQASAGTTKTFANLIDNLIQHGFSENFLSVLYYTAGALSKYDQNSHMLDTYLLFPGTGACGNYATTTNSACSALYGSDGGQTPARKNQGSTTTTTTTTPATTTTSSGAGSATPTTTTGSTTATTPGGIVGTIGQTLGNLGSTLGSTVGGVLGKGKGTSTTDQQTTTGSLSNLLNYLLK